MSRRAVGPLGWAALALVASFLFVPNALLAQEGEGAGEGAPPLPEADSIQLVFEREVFTYPSYERRNPFRPLTSPGDTGPRFEDLIFMGGIVAADPDASVALLGMRGRSGSGEAEGITHRLRRGQRIGNVRIVEIRSRELVVEVEEFGLTERRTMQLRRTEPTARADSVAADSADAEDSPPAQGDTITLPPDSVLPSGGLERGAAVPGDAGADARAETGTNGNGGT